MRKVIYIIFISFHILSAESSKDASFQRIARAIEEKKIYLAKSELEKLTSEYGNDPTIEFYQAELWTLEGEEEYIKENYIKANELFTKAYHVWPSNDLVRRRYEELKSSKLINKKRTNLFNNSTIGNHLKNEKKTEELKINEIMIDLKEIKGQNTLLLKESEYKFQYSIWILLGISYLFLIGLLVYIAHLRMVVKFLEKRIDENS